MSLAHRSLVLCMPERVSGGDAKFQGFWDGWIKWEGQVNFARRLTWIAAVGAKTAHIELGSAWENGYCESFNARFRDELLDREIFYNLREAQILIEQWRRHYNTKRPHSALDYRPPAPETIVPMDQRPVMH